MQTKFLSELKPKKPYSHCKLCKEKIFWVVTQVGKNMPVNYDEKIEYLFDGIARVPFNHKVMTSHFAICKFGDIFRKC